MPIYWISNNNNYEVKDENIINKIIENDQFYVLSKEGNLIKDIDSLKETLNYFVFSIEVNINNFIIEQKKSNNELNLVSNQNNLNLYEQSKNLINLIEENNKKNFIFAEAYLSMFNYLTKIKEIKFKNKKLVVNQFHQQISKIDYIHKNWFKNFTKLKEINIPEELIYDKAYFKLSHFFDEKLLVEYSDKSKLNLDILKDKIDNLKNQEIKEINKEFDFYESFIDNLYLKNPLKNKKFENLKNQLEEIKEFDNKEELKIILNNLKNFNENENLKYELPIDNFFLKITNFEKEAQIQNKYEFIKALLKKCEKESYFLEIFMDFKDSYFDCINEVNRRIKNNKILLTLINKISNFIKKEKSMRINFLNEYAKKLPNNFFPFLKNYLKDFNLNSLNEIINKDLPYNIEEYNNDELIKEVKLLIIDN